jgi:hypothetical protein
MPAPPKNRFAAKPEDQHHSEALYVRLTKEDKMRIVEAAGDTGVAAWARGVLLGAVAGTRQHMANQSLQRTATRRVRSNRK